MPLVILVELLYHISTREGCGLEGGAIMERNRSGEDTRTKDGTLLQESAIRQKVIVLLSKIDDLALLERIYRFIKYIYTHKT